MGNESNWTIAELTDEVGAALANDPAPSNRQVSPIPNLRTIRYYTTLGLLSAPHQMRGRTALYGVSHLHQLVAIKRLQVEGLTLAAVQARLAGASPLEIATIAKLPMDSNVHDEQGDQRVEFWMRTPSPSSPPSPSPPSSDPSAPSADLSSPLSSAQAADRSVAAAAPPAAEAPAAAFASKPNRQAIEAPISADHVGLDLAPGVTLLIATSQNVSTQLDAAALRRAAEPLLVALGLRKPNRPA